MKVYLFLICLFLSTSTFAQKIRFTDSSNVWSQLISVYNDGNPPLIYSYVYHFIGDTIINTHNYRKFNFNGFYGSAANNWSYVREDTFLNKVFIRDLINDSDVVLLDYNLKVGDTFTTIYDGSYHCYYQFIVTAIDSALINGVWHKIWHFPPSSNASGINFPSDIIEGIGCVQHPTYMLWRGGVEPPSPAVLCFSNRGISPSIMPKVYALDNTNSCHDFLHLDINNVSRSEKNNISPNPTFDEVSIFTDNIIEEASLCNSTGIVVASITPNSKIARFSLGKLPAGLYFVVIYSGENRQRSVSKVVKI